MDDFIKKYQQIMTMAMEAGIKSVPMSYKNGYPYVGDRKRFYEFISACHRGYAKAQSQLVREIVTLRNDDALTDSEKWYRELLYRKIADTIAFILLDHQTHVIRRLGIHDDPPFTPSDDLYAALEEAEKLNNESRKTFALLCDLTTFIHVCDLIRVDFRADSPKISFIEIKRGEVNSMLLSELEKSENIKGLLTKLSDNPNIESKYIPQAKRILKQKMRLQNISEIIRTDKGIDAKFNRPIFLKNPVIELEFYDSILSDLFEIAHENQLAATTIHYCIHIGVGFSKERQLASKYAHYALSYVINKAATDTESPIQGLREEIKILVPANEMWLLIHPFKSNLTGLFNRPFTIWKVDRKYLFELMNHTLVLLVIFDLAAFLWLARSQGLKAGLSSRKEASRLTQKYGKRAIPTFGNRCITISYQNKEWKMLGGMLSRFVNDFVPPLDVLKHFKTTPNIYEDNPSDK